ncbi:hypothetical protein SPHINGOT1_10038 [Sphingomonas sp. T1]|nr:hypothetical protein SPHINGOT1_10038 [Sphingomonas sp. T1]
MPDSQAGYFVNLNGNAPAEGDRTGVSIFRTSVGPLPEGGDQNFPVGS